MQICGLYPEKNHNQKHNCIPLFLGSPGASAGKESVCSAGDLGLIPGLGRSPGEGKGQPTPVFWSGESPWTEESDGLLSMGSQRIRNGRKTNIV